MKLSTHIRLSILALATLTFIALLACSQEPETVTVIKEIPVEKEVIREVEKEVIKEVIKEVPVEKIVEKIVEVVKEAPPTPEPETTMGPPIYQMGIFEEPISRNFWNYYGGPAGSVWTGYVLNGHSGSMYGYSDQRFDWVPGLAADFPTDLAKETVSDGEFWTAEVPLRTGVMWSDGHELDTGDFVFTVNTVFDLQLSSNWAAVVDKAFLERVEAIDSHTLKVYFKTTDAEGNPQTPGLSVWQFGLGFMPVMAEHYWAPIVEEVKGAGETEQQQEALFAHVPDGEPTLGGFTFSKWEPGAFFENDTDPGYYSMGTVVTNYANGAYSESNDRTGYSAAYFGEATGDKVLEYTVGPHVESEIFSIYGNQDAAILALTKGDIDYVFNPLGLEKGFLDRVRNTPDLQIAANANNGVRYMGFNVRKPPMDITEFRQAIATVIDKEFVARTVLQDAAIPVYAMVPEGNEFWHNADVPKFGQGLSRGERIAQAVELLKGAGFTYEQEPEISEDGNFVAKQGKGLKMPDGSPVPEMTLLAPSAGYDPMRSTFAIWVERWMNDIGIPVRAHLTGFNVIVDELFSDTVAEDLDMWILGWGLSIFPDYLENFFHSRHSPEIGGGYNWGGYANGQFDELSLGLLSETTIEGARDKVFQLQEFLAEELPYVPLFTTPKLDAYRPSRVEFPYTSVLGGLEQQGGMQQTVLIK
jgi:ABC-type transport system substrate-binding protein